MSSRSHRPALIVGAVAVLAALVVLVILVAKASSTEDTASAAPVTDPATKPVVPPPLQRDPSVTVTERPRGESAPTLPAAGENPREYAVGDVTVRDHRAGDNKPLDVPPNVHPPEGRLIPSSLTHAISQKVKAVMKDCVASLPREGRGTKPRLEGQILIGIKDKSLSVTKSTIQMRDLDALDATVVDAAKQCVESRAIGQSTPAPDEADLESYTINLSFTIQ